MHEETAPEPKRPSLEPMNPTDFVLRLITDKAMTSRDIQITLKRSREHTSRLMKKLFEDGYVQRNIESKPYTYSITEKGIAKIENLQTINLVCQLEHFSEFFSCEFSYFWQLFWCKSSLEFYYNLLIK